MGLADALFGVSDFTPGMADAYRRMQEFNTEMAYRLANHPLMRAGRTKGTYWQRTGGKSHAVTFVREDEMFFRAVPVRTAP